MLKKSNPKKTKVTTVEGYLAGDRECFCLRKISFEGWTKIKLPYPVPLLIYPVSFFLKKLKRASRNSRLP